MKKGKGRQTKAHPTSLHKKGKKKLSIHEWGAYISDYDTDSEASMSQHHTPVPSQHPSHAASPSAQASTSVALQHSQEPLGPQQVQPHLWGHMEHSDLQGFICR